jgi:threonine dehydrogenase-like Zn-dependent dehydrogenase
VFGVSAPDAVAAVSPYDIFARELTISGSQSLQHTLHRAVQVLAAGLLDGDAFITDRIPLTEVKRALDVVRRGEGVKTQLIPR